MCEREAFNREKKFKRISDQGEKLHFRRSYVRGGASHIHFWPLVFYEYRKLFRHKLVFVAFAVMTAVCIFGACSRLFGNSYAAGQIYESHREALEKDIMYEKALSGRILDDTLLKEMQDGFASVPDVPLAGISEEYQTYARPYKAVWQFACLIVGTPAWESVTEEELYAARQRELEGDWTSKKLGGRERELLKAADEKVDKPFIYTYCEGWGVLCNLMNMLCVLQLLFIAVCIPPIFSHEHSRRTDQLIQCTGLGKKPLYLAKLFVGVTCSLAASLFLALATAVPLFCIYGKEGAGAALQLYYFKFVWPLTMGEAALILLGLLLVTAIFRTILAMLMAECFRSSTVPLAFMTGFLILSLLFRVPEEYRLLSQIWEMVPVNLVSVRTAFASRLYPFFGAFLTPWQAAPCIYLALAAGAAVLCFRQYRSFQAGGR